MLAEEEFMQPPAPQEQAWLALARNDLTSAEAAVALYGETIAAKMRGWDDLLDDETTSLFSLPTQTLQIELRGVKPL